MSHYFEIAYALASKRLCLFTGTGFSRALSDNKAPGWQELLEGVCDDHLADTNIKDTLFPRDNDGSTKRGINPLALDEAAQVIKLELANRELFLHEIIAEQINQIKPSGKAPNTEAFLKEQSYVLVTTNYDKLAQKIAGEKCQTITPGLPIPRLSWEAKALHIHGSVDAPNRMVVTADDYFNFMRSESFFARKLSTILHENTVVILGYSLGDTNLKAILNDYQTFTSNLNVGSSIFLVSQGPVDQRIADYYSHCYGIRVIENTEVEDFFERLNRFAPIADRRRKKTLSNINKVLEKNGKPKTHYLKTENSFYEVIAALGAKGVALDNPKVIELFSYFIAKKMELCREDGAWEQYTHLSAWLCYLGNLLNIPDTALEAIFNSGSLFSMERMSKEYRLGYSWQAYKTWSARWSSITAGNRNLIASYIKEHSIDPDALEIVSRG